MSVCNQFKINQNHTKSDFSHKTFSGFKKREVINTLFKSIESGKNAFLQ